MASFYRFTQLGLKAFFRIFYRHQVIFPEGVEYPEAAIIAPNHLSFLDPPLLAASWPDDIHFFARASLFKNRLFHFLISSLNAHPVGGGNDLKSIKLACKLLEEKKKILIFPEGTRSAHGGLNPFKKGVGMLAVKTGAPIIPTYIHGTFDIWPKNRKIPKLFGQRTACVFGKPIIPLNKDVEAIVQQVEQEIALLQQQYLNRKT